MAVPTLEVSIAFNDGPYVWSPTWVDVSAYVRKVNIFRGRQDDFSEFDAGSASVVLDNVSRLFDPFNTSGTYYGKLTPRRQIRIRAINGGVPYNLFRGFINGFPVVRSSSSNDSTVTVSCTDMFGLATATNIKGSLADWYVQNSLSAGWRNSYKLSDPDQSTVLIDRKSGEHMTYKSGKKVRSSEKLAFGLFDKSLDTSGSLYEKKVVAAWDGTIPNIWAISFWAALNQTLGQWYVPLALQDTRGTSVTFGANIVQGAPNTAGYVNVYMDNDNSSPDAGFTGISSTNSSIGYLCSDIAHHFVIVWNGNTATLKLYVDGADVSSVAMNSGAGNLRPPFSINVFGGGVFQNLDIWGAQSGILDFTAAQIKALYDYGNGYKVSTTATRMEELRAMFNTEISTDWVSFHTDADSFGAIMGLPEKDSSLIDNWKLTMRTEGGYVFCLADGRIKSTGRQYLSTNATSLTSQCTFTDNGAGIGYMGDIEFAYDGENMRNDISVAYGGGNQFKAENPTSITNRGRHSESIDTACSTLEEARELAQYLVGYASREVPSVSAFEVGLPATTAAQWLVLLQLDLLQRVTFVNTPPTGSAFSKTLHINAIQWELTPKNWSMVLLGTARYTDVFILNSSLLDGSDVLA